MTDEELIAEMRRVGPAYRRSDVIADKHVGWLLAEAARRLEGRAAAQAADTALVSDTGWSRPAGKAQPAAPARRLEGRAAAQATEDNHER